MAIDFTKSKYSPKAKQFLSKDPLSFNLFTLLDGSVRSGKTVNIIYKIPQIFEAIGNGSLKVFSGFSKNTVRNNVLVELIPYLKNYHRADIKYNSSSGELDIKLHKKLYNCLIVGAGNAGSDAAIQGGTWDFWYSNELSKHHYSFYNMALSRLSGENARAFADSNPESQNHWLYSEKIKPWMENDATVREVFDYWHFTMDDNYNLAPAYVEAQKKLYQGAFYERKILGQWRIAEGLVYDTFDEAKHTCSHDQALKKIKNNEFVEYFCGLDWGWNHKTAVGLYGITRTGVYYKIDELYENKIEADSVIQWVKNKQQEYQRHIRFIEADNARPEQNHKIRQAGWVVYEEKPGVTDSIAVVRGIINYDRLIVNRDRCPNFINEIQSYRYPSEDERHKISTEKWDHPLKEFDDAMDETRYALTLYETRYGRQFKKVA